MSYSRKSEKGYLSFAQGLMTELSPLMTPEDFQGTTSDELNMEVDTDGMIRTRRSGFQFLSGVQDTVSETVLDAEYWKAAKCYVVLSYYTISKDDLYTVCISMVDTTDQTKNRMYRMKVPVVNFQEPSVCFLRTKCLVTFGARPVVITRNQDLEYTVQYIDLYARDFKILPDGLTITERPTTLTDAHKYNLLNSSWDQPRALKSSNTVADPITNFFTVRSKYPSNADIAYLGDITDSNGDLKFDPMSYDNLNLGSTEAPRGHYVFNIRGIDRQAKLSTPGNDGSPSDTLTTMVLSGKNPITTAVIPIGAVVDAAFPELETGVMLP